ncbi:thiamine ABC transporter substrate binding subunit [Tianweitania sp. BSSL-BM11]|uniref:Thiamine ABC transporter substrate binding subunit n=1 Tax=Tianweitania aestuarii TaxID=2814886 RepID=A0ABS5RZ65_9HYPH|nr:thiamine ABC transporter substrate binding subunit [Tianweitania aestuarii]MBS9722331.1 thiamine ABC transporter substrate binding subunit [Tianweitania aestuarii]
MRNTGLTTLLSLTLALGVLPAATATAKAAENTLTIYTYDSFTAEWGPGPIVEKAFEAQCSCQVDFVSVADGVALLNRIKLEGANTKADLVLGLDTNLTTEARATNLFVPHGISAESVAVPGGWNDDTFLPYDYGYFAVVYDTEKLQTPPTSLKDLVEGDPSQKIVIQDPRTSTPGLGLLLWIKSVYGDDAGNAWAKLKNRVLTVTPGWSEAYGLFTKNEAPMVLSYTTSPAYHIIADKTERYQAASFSEGHYLQVEVAGMTKKGAENPLAKQFLQFMLTPSFQDAVPETQWMLPAAKTSEPLDEAFDRMVKPTKSLTIPSDEIAEKRKTWIDEWLQVMSR